MSALVGCCWSSALCSVTFSMTGRTPTANSLVRIKAADNRQAKEPAGPPVQSDCSMPVLCRKDLHSCGAGRADACCSSERQRWPAMPEPCPSSCAAHHMGSPQVQHRSPDTAVCCTTQICGEWCGRHSWQLTMSAVMGVPMMSTTMPRWSSFSCKVKRKSHTHSGPAVVTEVRSS